MKTIIIEGLISKEYNNSFDTIFITDKTGWKFDLVDKFIEIGNNGINKVQVSYFISEEIKTFSQAKKDFLINIYGGFDAGKNTSTCGGSSWTGSWTEYDTELMVGGHNLYQELGSYEGKYISMQILINPGIE